MYKSQGFYIPSRMESGIKMWIDHGVMPGGFIRAIIENDLRSAVERADSENLANIPAYVSYFYNEAPMMCWGSKERVENWAAMKLKEREGAESSALANA